MCEKVSVKVTVNNNATATGQTQKPSLDLQKIYDQIIERETDADKGEKAKKLLRFLIAVEAVEKLENPKTGGDIKFILPEAVAKLLDGKLDLKLTDPGFSKTPMCVNVVVGSPSDESPASSFEIEGEFYKNGQKKWRPWWRCDRWLFNRSEDAQKKFFGIEKSLKYTGEYSLKNTNQKVRIALRDLVLAQKKGEESGQVVLTCPFTTVILLERVEGKTASHEYNGSEWKCVREETVAIKVHQLPTIDHLIPTSLVSGSNPLASGNNLLAVSARANALKADWFPSEVNEWLSREKYVAACRNYIANEAPQESSEYSKIYNGIFK
jgi:hypothetical protein